jgi:hypothetical protein
MLTNSFSNIITSSNLTYTIDQFNNNHLIRQFDNADSYDFLPKATNFINLFDIKEIKQTYSWKITNNTNNILIINPADNMIFKDNVYIIPSNETFDFIACIFSLDPIIIGVVKI